MPLQITCPTQSIPNIVQVGIQIDFFVVRKYDHGVCTSSRRAYPFPTKAIQPPHIARSRVHHLRHWRFVVVRAATGARYVYIHKIVQGSAGGSKSRRKHLLIATPRRRPHIRRRYLRQLKRAICTRVGQIFSSPSEAVDQIRIFRRGK